MQLKAEFKTSADVPNWLGFCHRKLKDYPRARAFYDEALTYNPTHLGANEYLGEWYVETGDLAKAREQLAYLTGLCGNCEEAKDLAEALREGAEDAVGRVAGRRQTGSKGRSPPAGFSA